MLLLIFFALSLLTLLFPAKAFAVCPVCTVAVGAGLGLSRWLGIDDTVSGLWVGGLIWSSSFWLASWLDKRNVRFPHKTLLSAVILYLMVIPSLYFFRLMGGPLNNLWGINKLILGTVIGSITFLAGVQLDRYLRKFSNGKAAFPYQRVILPVYLLLVASVIFYLITRR